MCLIITKFNKLEVAQEDIKCYKILFNFSRFNILAAPYRDFNYKLGETYHTDISVSYDYCTSGLSLFTQMFYDFFNSFLDVKGVNQGFHSFVKLKNAIRERNSDIDYKSLVVCECIIPKGAKYYKGKYLHYDGYVSDNIKINKIIYP